MKDIPQATSHQQPCPILQRGQTGASVRTGPNVGLSIVKRSSRWSLELTFLIISLCPPQTQNNTKVFNDLEIFGASQPKHTKASWQSWPSIVLMGRSLDLTPSLVSAARKPSGMSATSMIAAWWTNRCTSSTGPTGESKSLETANQIQSVWSVADLHQDPSFTLCGTISDSSLLRTWNHSALLNMFASE